MQIKFQIKHLNITHFFQFHTRTDSSQAVPTIPQSTQHTIRTYGQLASCPYTQTKNAPILPYHSKKGSIFLKYLIISIPHIRKDRSLTVPTITQSIRPETRTDSSRAVRTHKPKNASILPYHCKKEALLYTIFLNKHMITRR